jgi:hypothetical protein
LGRKGFAYEEEGRERRMEDRDDDFLDKMGSTDGVELRMRSREEAQKVQAKIEEKFRERKQKTRERSRMMFREKLQAVRTERGSPTKPADPHHRRRANDDTGGDPSPTASPRGHDDHDDHDDHDSEEAAKREREHKERESGSPARANGNGHASDDDDNNSSSSDDDDDDQVRASPAKKSPRPAYLADLSSSDVLTPPPPTQCTPSSFASHRFLVSLSCSSFFCSSFFCSVALLRSSRPPLVRIRPTTRHQRHQRPRPRCQTIEREGFAGRGRGGAAAPRGRGGGAAAPGGDHGGE